MTWCFPLQENEQMLDQLNKVQGGAVDEAVLDSAVLMKRWNAMQVCWMGFTVENAIQVASLPLVCKLRAFPCLGCGL